MHPDRKRQIIRRIFKQRIAPDVHLVEIDPRQEGGKPERLLVGDEVDFVASLSQRDAHVSVATAPEPP